MPYLLVGDDNYMFFLQGRDDVLRCPVCGVHTHPFDHGFPQTQVPKNHDLSHCVEGFELASPRLKGFLQDHCTSPVDYFETGGGFFVLRPHRAVFEDVFARPVEYDQLCERCGRYNACYATPMGILKGQREVGEFDLVRSALERGPEGQRNFFLIAGDGLVKAMKAEKFKGANYTSYTNEDAAIACLQRAADLHGQRRYKESVELYEDFLNSRAFDIPQAADRKYLSAYAEYFLVAVGRKIGRKRHTNLDQAQLQELVKGASRPTRAAFPAP